MRTVTIGEAMTLCRLSLRLTPTEIAAKCGVSAGMWRAYEREETAPRLDKAVMIADTLGVSLHELVGSRLGEPRGAKSRYNARHITKTPEECLTAGDWMRWSRESRGITATRLGDISGVTKDSILRIEHGCCGPNITTVRCLADALGITIDEYIGRRTNI